MVEQIIIIGAGQAGLSTAYYLKRNGLNPLILDATPTPGGAWTKGWDSLMLFSPKEYSSLSGLMMPKTEVEYPSRNEIINYLSRYEKHYDFRVERPVQVQNVEKKDGLFYITTDTGVYQSHALVSATGNFSGASTPYFEGIGLFKGEQIHSSEYQNNKPFEQQNVAVIGSGNSGSQILAEVSEVANTHWFTNRPLQYLDDDLDGRYLFDLSTKRYYASLKGETLENTDDFSKIVMTQSVKEARDRGVLVKEEDIIRFTEDSIVTKNKTIPIDAIVWCTGFKTQLEHLQSLELDSDLSKISDGTRSNQHKGLWFIGYGEWSGYASATIVGVQKHAREAAKQISEALSSTVS